MHSPLSPSAHKDLALLTVASGLIITIASHAFMDWHFTGLPLFLCVTLGVITTLAVAHRRGKPLNSWSVIFLAPVFLGLAAASLYASSVAQVGGASLALVSFIMWSYWLTAAPVSWEQLPHLHLGSMFTDLEKTFPETKHAINATELTKNGGLGRIAKGFLIAAPLLILCASLFAGADIAFQQALAKFFAQKDVTKALFLDIPRSILIFCLVTGILWTTSKREKHEAPEKNAKEADALQTGTVLVLTNLLFGSFLYFQARYLFGGNAALSVEGISYAEYARQGFGELLTISAIILGTTLYFWRAQALQGANKALSLLLLAQTGVITASAGLRLSLYTQAFGLTIARIWAALAIISIAVSLVSILISIALTKSGYGKFMKHYNVATLIAFGALLLWNWEGTVAQYNISRFITHKQEKIDAEYLAGELSADAHITVKNFLMSLPPETAFEKKTFYTGLSPKEVTVEELLKDLGQREDRIQETRWHWRSVTEMLVNATAHK